MAKRKRTNNDLQNTTQKTKDRAQRTPLKTVVNSCDPGRWYFLLHLDYTKELEAL